MSVKEAIAINVRDGNGMVRDVGSVGDVNVADPQDVPIGDVVIIILPAKNDEGIAAVAAPDNVVDEEDDNPPPCVVCHKSFLSFDDLCVHESECLEDNRTIPCYAGTTIPMSTDAIMMYLISEHQSKSSSLGLENCKSA